MGYSGTGGMGNGLDGLLAIGTDPWITERKGRKQPGQGNCLRKLSSARKPHNPTGHVLLTLIIASTSGTVLELVSPLHQQNKSKIAALADKEINYLYYTRL